MNEENTPKLSASTKKQNQDFPNIPASTEKHDSGEEMKEQVKESSKLNEDGKTDNTEKNSGN